MKYDQLAKGKEIRFGGSNYKIHQISRYDITLRDERNNSVVVKMNDWKAVGEMEER